MNETRFFERGCYLIGFSSFEQIMREITNDQTVTLDIECSCLACYSSELDYGYDEVEIIERISDYLGKKITAAFVLCDAEEIYFIFDKGAAA